MNDDRLEDGVLRVLADVTAPPEVPRAAMWDRIVPGLRDAPPFAAPPQLGPDRIIGARPARRSPWAAMLQAAAVLAIGIAVGRATTSRTPAARTHIYTRQATAPVSRTVANSLVLSRHLSDAEVLLTEFRSESAAAPDLAARAGDLLATTRHLLDAPAARDPELHAMLEDLELVLVQLARLHSDRGRDTAGFVRKTIEHRDLLGRLQVESDRGI